MRTTVTVLVRLKIPDVIAATALHTVKARLGHADIDALRRADAYTLTVEAADVDAALALVHRMVEQTASFANPNKHTVEYRTGGLPQSETDTAHIHVRLGEDAKASLMLESLRDDPRFGEALVGLERGALWTIQRTGGARETAESLAVTHRRDLGLFANPHAEEAVLL